MIVRGNARSKLAFSLVATILLWCKLESAGAVELEPQNQALVHVLGTSKAFQKKATVGGKPVTAFYAKDASGKPSRVAYVEHGLYPPDCTHTWVVGVDPANGQVTEVRPVEMSCPHGLPSKASSFLDQFKGKGPADEATVVKDAHTIAKATGTCVLAAEAVKRSITEYQAMKAAFK